jgi:hypothetical protein
MRATLAGLVALVVFTIGAAAAGSEAKGTVAYKNKSGEYTLAPKFAYVVTGRDVADSTRTIARLIFSETDIAAALQGCASMMCVDGQITEGFVVDITDGPRLNSWLTLNKGRVQYSGPQAPASLTLTTESATRIAGKLAFDASAAGGPKVDVTFDAPVIKELTQRPAAQRDPASRW